MAEPGIAQAHGGLREQELRALRLKATDILDFSASINPLGASPAAVAALPQLDYSHYPDPDASALREAIARAAGVTPEEVLPGNGATELIHLVVRAFVRQGQRPVVFAPTFGEFERACTLAGATVHPWHANPRRGFRWNFDNKGDVLRRVTPPLLYLCAPNNPTGIYPSRLDVASLAGALVGGPLLLDESYVAFVDEPWNSVALMHTGRVLVLRSMTKDYGLAGLRLGYLLGAPSVIAAVRRLQPEWSVSAAAQAAGVAALADPGHIEAGRTIVRESRAYLVEALTGLGLAVTPSSANFLLVEVGQATALRLGLLRRGLAVRDCTSFGLPDHIRIGIRRQDECERLVLALRRELSERERGP